MKTRIALGLAAVVACSSSDDTSSTPITPDPIETTVTLGDRAKGACAGDGGTCAPGQKCVNYAVILPSMASPVCVEGNPCDGVRCGRDKGICASDDSENPVSIACEHPL